MHLGILVTCFVPLLHNRLSRQLGQLSTPPPTLFSLSAPLFFRHLVLYPFLFLSFFLRLSLSLSIFVLLFAEHSLSSLPCSLQSLLFQPHLSISSFLFWQPPLFLLPVLSLPAYSPVSPTRRQSWALLEETPVPAIIEIKSSILALHLRTRCFICFFDYFIRFILSTSYFSIRFLFLFFSIRDMKIN